MAYAHLVVSEAGGPAFLLLVRLFLVPFLVPVVRVFLY